MSFRNRPVLDRRHRPRWQDELRTQQLVIAGFAVAIALALGIFGATAWNAYWESHLRPVASVGDTTFDRSDLTAREGAIAAELVAEATELDSQRGGLRDQLIDQQIGFIQQQLQGVTGAAADSLVQGAVLAQRAGELGIAVSHDEVDAEVAERMRLPERVHLRLIVVNALPDGAEADAEPTDEQLAAAVAEAEELRERIDGGASFESVATEASDDFTAQLGGDIGWVTADDAGYAEEFTAAEGADEGEIIGPIETDDGARLLQVVERRESANDETLAELIDRAGGDAAYRAYVRDELLVEAYRTHFGDEVVVSPAAQVRVAQIVIRPVTGTPIPQERARHVLVQPLPGEQDQSTATDEQWAAALAEAEEMRAELAAEDADWFVIAEEHSDDPGSGSRGGDLGWYDPANPGFVAQFAATLEILEVMGEVSEPVRSDFGYHVIQKTGERLSPQVQAAELAERLQAEPDSFAAVATVVSEDHATAEEGGELGWVARYQLPEAQEEAVFALSEVGEVSDPVDLGADGIFIFRLLETDGAREIEEERLDQIRSAGFDRWLAAEVTDPVTVWVDPQFASGADDGA